MKTNIMMVAMVVVVVLAVVVSLAAPEDSSISLRECEEIAIRSSYLGTLGPNGTWLGLKKGVLYAHRPGDPKEEPYPLLPTDITMFRWYDTSDLEWASLNEAFVYWTVNGEIRQGFTSNFQTFPIFSNGRCNVQQIE